MDIFKESNFLILHFRIPTIQIFPVALELKFEMLQAELIHYLMLQQDAYGPDQQHPLRLQMETNLLDYQKLR
jgi:hypothetical protein